MCMAGIKLSQGSLYKDPFHLLAVDLLLRLSGVCEHVCECVGPAEWRHIGDASRRLWHSPSARCDKWRPQTGTPTVRPWKRLQWLVAAGSEVMFGAATFLERTLSFIRVIQGATSNLLQRRRSVKASMGNPEKFC